MRNQSNNIALKDGIYDDEQEAYQLPHNRLNDMNRLIADLNQMAAADIGHW